MERCDRCGCEIFDFFYLSYSHSKRNEEGHFYICPNCKIELDKYLINSKKKQFGYRVTLDEYAPGGYKTMRAEDEES